jgi:hypothetical protein
MPAASLAETTEVADRRRHSRAGRLANGVREGLEIVRCRSRGLGELQPDDLPPERSGEPGRVARAQVVAVRLGVGGKRTEHRSGLCVDVRERCDRGLTARGAGATSKRAHEREG